MELWKTTSARTELLSHSQERQKYNPKRSVEIPPADMGQY